MKNNKLLIISYYWPPSGGSGVQRWLNFSNSLVKKGWDITVFTAENANFPILDNELENSINQSIKVFRIPILEPTSLFKKNSSNRYFFNKDGYVFDNNRIDKLVENYYLNYGDVNSKKVFDNKIYN